MAHGLGFRSGLERSGLTISFFNLLLPIAVLWLILVVLVSQAPFVTGEDTSWLEHAEDLTVALYPVRSMAGCFDGKHSIERCILSARAIAGVWGGIE